MKKQKDAQTIFFHNTLVTNILIFFMVLITVVCVLINNAYSVVKDTRLEILRQQAENNRKISRVLKFLVEEIYHNWENADGTFQLQEYQKFAQEVEGDLSEKAKLLDNLEVYPYVTLIMKDGYVFSTGSVTEHEIKAIRSSSWYISNMSNPRKNFWISLYNYSYKDLKTDIAYGKSILDDQGNYRGVIMISMMTDYLGENTEFTPEKGIVRYILDENGYAITHSIPSLLGSGLYHMPYFHQLFQADSGQLLKKNSRIVLHLNYYDEETGWTIVEEQEISVFFHEFSNIFLVGLILLLFSILLSVVASFLLARKITRPIVTMTTQMIASSAGEIDKIELQKDYKEIIVLSNIYNLIVEKMNHLIEQRKEEERKKRQLELLFLQAQINPHFLHNTLFSVKCLIEMNQPGKAELMLASLMKMLKIPIGVSSEWITIQEEIEYLQSYLSLMRTRYEQRKIVMNIAIDKEAERAVIPRLMLQPIIENSIFHGFDDEGNGQTAMIDLEVRVIEKRLLIRIIDNGKGMSRLELENLWNASRKNSEVFNRVGLANIQQRIKLLCGEAYGMVVLSQEGEGTESIITLRFMTEEEIHG